MDRISKIEGYQPNIEVALSIIDRVYPTIGDRYPIDIFDK
jgi:hypothetical protein